MDQPSALPEPDQAFEYEEAVERLSEWLDHPPRPGSLDHSEFEQVLDRIARYLPPSPRINAASDAAAPIGEDLERRIRAALNRRSGAHEDHHWEPMVGGDVRGAPSAA